MPYFHLDIEPHLSQKQKSNWLKITKITLLVEHDHSWFISLGWKWDKNMCQTFCRVKFLIIYYKKQRTLIQRIRKTWDKYPASTWPKDGILVMTLTSATIISDIILTRTNKVVCSTKAKCKLLPFILKVAGKFLKKKEYITFVVVCVCLNFYSLFSCKITDFFFIGADSRKSYKLISGVFIYMKT